MPNWEQDAGTYNKDLMLLGSVKQKVLNIQWWRLCMHQLLLYVGTARQGLGARQRQRINPNVARTGQGQRQVKQRWTWVARRCG